MFKKISSEALPLQGNLLGEEELQGQFQAVPVVIIPGLRGVPAAREKACVTRSESIHLYNLEWFLEHVGPNLWVGLPVLRLPCPSQWAVTVHGKG